jgi:hypothetical protein
MSIPKQWPHTIYTMQDVNRVVMSTGWTRMIALSYFIDLADKTGQNVSYNLEYNYNKEVKTNAR